MCTCYIHRIESSTCVQRMLLEWTDSAAHPHDGPHTHTQTGEAATKATRTMNKKKKQKAKREGPPAKLFGASSDGWRQVKHSSGRHQTRKRPSCAGPSALLSSGRPFWKASSAVSFLASAPLICKPRSSHFSSFVIRFAWPLFYQLRVSTSLPLRFSSTRRHSASNDLIVF